MQASVEISMYPLAENYKPSILDFIKRLRSIDGLEVRSNGMSSQVFGEYNLLMSSVQSEVKKTFVDHKNVALVFKLFNADLRESPQFD